MSQSEIVVGVNGSPSSLRAAEHAGAEAARRGLPLLLLHAWQTYPLYEGSPLFSTEDVEQAEGWVLADAQAALRRTAPDVEVRTRLRQERADVALIEASRSAALLFAGCHGGSSFWMGPVLGHITTHAHCPVVAVPPTAAVGPGDVVVGVDGSAVSSAAVGFAFDQAARWDATLRAVLAVTPTFDAYVASPEALDELRERGRRHLAESLAGHRDRHPDVEVQCSVSVSDAVPALQEAAAGAGLLVVGSHGRGALLRVALGSVSGSLLRAAPCPVAVVRSEHAITGHAIAEHVGADEHLVPVPLL